MTVSWYSEGMSTCAVLSMVEEYMDLTGKMFGKEGHEFLFRCGGALSNLM